MQPFRILSLDGGGSWALIEVKALIALYGAGATGHEVLSHFDLAAANSGGSIVLGWRTAVKTRTIKKMSRSSTMEYAPRTSARTIFDSERGRNAVAFIAGVPLAPNENKMSDGWRESVSLQVEGGISSKVRNQSCQPFAPSHG